ncbi:MAG: ATP-binding cassette domain-containing protein [Bacteroides sp.]|nr:ATP-binding cassette domain-containing protein [Bacteroides sp.]
MLRITNASIAYGKELLFSDFSMQLHRGEMVCISGKSGKGKTSLLNAIMGFVPLSQGEIIVNGSILNKANIDSIRRNIAWIPQELALPSEWVKDMVRIPFNLKANKQHSFPQKELFHTFTELGLEEELYYKRVVEISGGQRQRIMLAIACLLAKPLILVDEPTSALDFGSMDRVLTFFHKTAQKGSAILVVSHDEHFAAGCNRIIYL